MRCQHQFDFQAADLPCNELVAVSGGLEAFDQIGEHTGFERYRLACRTATNLMVLLGDIGQVEELVERPCHRQQFIPVKAVERLGQQLRTLGRAFACRLGTLADAFDLVEELVAMLGANGVAEQFAKQVYVVAQARVDDFRHDLLAPPGLPPSHERLAAAYQTRRGENDPERLR